MIEDTSFALRRSLFGPLRERGVRPIINERKARQVEAKLRTNARSLAGGYRRNRYWLLASFTFLFSFSFFLLRIGMT